MLDVVAYLLPSNYMMQAFNGDRLRAECPPYKVAKEEEFTPTQLVTRLKEQFGKKLCAVIDLTFTKRYYNSKVCLLAAGSQCRYSKCMRR